MAKVTGKTAKGIAKANTKICSITPAKKIAKALGTAKANNVS